MAKKKKDNIVETNDIRLKPEGRNWLVLFGRITFFICAFFAVLCTVLYNMGGTSDTLREGFEQFASRIFGGRPAKVDKLVRMTFFPTISADVEGLNVYPYPNAVDSDIHADKLKLAMGFWSYPFAKSNFKAIYIENFDSKAGALGAKAIKIDKVYIDHDRATNKALLRGKGKYDVHDWNMSLSLGVGGNISNYNYTLFDNMTFEGGIADIGFSGLLKNHTNDFSGLRDLKITQGDHSFWTDIDVNLIEDGLLKVKSIIRFDEDKEKNNGVLNFDLVVDLKTTPIKISGTVTGHKVAWAQIDGQGSLTQIINRIGEIFSREDGVQQDFFSVIQPYDLDIKVSLNEMRAFDVDNNHVNFSMLQNQGRAKIYEVSGKVGGEDLIVPDLYFVEQKEDQAMAVKKSTVFFLMQDGKFSASPLVKLWSPAVYETVFSAPVLEQNCASASFAYDERQLRTKDFYVAAGESSLLAAGNIDLKNAALDMNVHASGLAFKSGGHITGMIAAPVMTKSNPIVANDNKGKIMLQTAGYDFITAGLKSKDAAHPCLALVEKDPRSVELEKQEAERKAQEEKAAMEKAKSEAEAEAKAAADAEAEAQKE